MGELLLCNEAIAAMPYYIEGVSINVYSIEELNYYIINNTYLLDDDFMSLELCTWIENHAHLPKLAMHLRTIISTNGRLSAVCGYNGSTAATALRRSLRTHMMHLRSSRKRASLSA